MLNVKHAFLAATMLAAVASPALAADMDAPVDSVVDGWYLRADAGWSFLAWSGRDDSAFVGGGGIGYRFNENMRTDLRVDWAGTYDLNPPRDMDVTTVLGNLYFDIPTDTAFTPYVGAGAGYGWGSVDNGRDKDGMAFALMAGAEVAMSDNLSLDVGYRFRSIMSDGANPMEHQVLMGVRYGF